MTNLFSSFDPNVRIFIWTVSANWVSTLIAITIIPQAYWLIRSQAVKSTSTLMRYLEGELLAVFGPLSIPGTIYIFVSIFLFTLLLNFIGLFPYIFTRTSHLVITLSVALPLWLGRIMWALLHQSNRVLAHLVPLGTPGALGPLIVVIETVRNVIRPGTLSVRLAANMVAGHLLLTLLGTQGAGVSISTLYLLIVGLVLLLILEVGVACIQAYVFTILRALYLSEVSRSQFNRQMVN